MEKKLNEYKLILLRFDKAVNYFNGLSSEEISNIENAREYQVLKALINRGNQLYTELKLKGMDI